MINTIVGDLRARPWTAKLTSCEKELKESLSNEGNQKQGEVYVNIIKEEAHVLHTVSRKLGRLTHLNLTLKWRTQERGCRISLQR